jgi:hypothetical protein
VVTIATSTASPWWVAMVICGIDRRRSILRGSRRDNCLRCLIIPCGVLLTQEAVSTPPPVLLTLSSCMIDGSVAMATSFVTMETCCWHGFSEVPGRGRGRLSRLSIDRWLTDDVSRVSGIASIIANGVCIHNFLSECCSFCANSMLHECDQHPKESRKAFTSLSLVFAPCIIVVN